VLATLLLIVLCASGGCLGASSSSEPTCAFNPALKARPSRAASGETSALRGGGFSGGICNDHQGDARANPPDRDVSIALRQDGRTWRLGTVPAGPKYSFDAKLTVPTEAKPGRASVIASGDVGGAEEGFAVLEKRTDERTEAGSGSAGQRVLPGARGRGSPGRAARRHAGPRRGKLHPTADGRARPRRDGFVFARVRPASSGRQDPRAGWEGAAKVGEEVTMGGGYVGDYLEGISGLDERTRRRRKGTTGAPTSTPGPS
jgi:hypothetical protein